MGQRQSLERCSQKYNWMSTCKKTKLDTYLKPFTKINLKCITSLNVKCETINLLEDNMGESLDDFGYGDDFLDTTPKI